MTKLLVSVRDVREAALAHAGGADVIDVKEPALGSLGAASPLVWEEIKEFVRALHHRARPHFSPTDFSLSHGKDSRSDTRPNTRLSVALGELTDPAALPNAQGATGVDYAKLGLARCADILGWERSWEATLQALPQGVKPVAVVYADHETARSPAPPRVIEVAATLGCVAVLFDTFEKTSGDLFAHLPPHRLAEHMAESHAKGMFVVLGGSLRGPGIHRALELAPDYVAVRGAVCRESRSGPIDVDLVRQVASQVCEFQSSASTTEIYRQA